MKNIKIYTIMNYPKLKAFWDRSIPGMSFTRPLSDGRLVMLSVQLFNWKLQLYESDEACGYSKAY